MYKMRRAEHVPLKSQSRILPWTRLRTMEVGTSWDQRNRVAAIRMGPLIPVDCLPLRHGVTVFRQIACPVQVTLFGTRLQHLVLLTLFCTRPISVRVAQALQVFRQPTPIKEHIMKLQFGQNQLVLELSHTPFAWFHGQTERMSLTSLSLLFVQFSLFARQPAA